MPSERSHLFLAVYDVSKDRERDRVARLLEGYGVRIQKSVFEIRTNRPMKERLLREARAIGLSSGFLFLYRVDETAPRERAGVEEAEALNDGQHSWLL